MGSRSPSRNDDVGVQTHANHGRSYSRDVGAENNEAIPGMGAYHNARDFAAQGTWPMQSMTPGDGEDDGWNDDRSQRPHVQYPYDNSMGTTPAHMDTLSTISTADIPSVRRRSTVRSGIFKTVDDFQDFDVGGPGWHRTQAFYNRLPGSYANYDVV